MLISVKEFSERERNKISGDSQEKLLTGTNNGDASDGGCGYDRNEDSVRAWSIRE